MVTGPHLKGATLAMVGLALTATVVHFGAQNELARGIVIGVLASSMRSMDAGPMGEIWKAMTGWILNPVTEKFAF